MRRNLLVTGSGIMRCLTASSLLSVTLFFGLTHTVLALDINQLEQRLRALGPGDRSVIIHSATNPGSVMTTSPGSPNDSLWSEMEKVGWTKQVDVFAKPGENNPLAGLLRTFALTDSGAEAVKKAAAKLQVR